MNALEWLIIRLEGRASSLTELARENRALTSVNDVATALNTRLLLEEAASILKEVQSGLYGVNRVVLGDTLTEDAICKWLEASHEPIGLDLTDYYTAPELAARIRAGEYKHEVQTVS